MTIAGPWLPSDGGVRLSRWLVLPFASLPHHMAFMLISTFGYGCQSFWLCLGSVDVLVLVLGEPFEVCLGTPLLVVGDAVASCLE